MPSRIDIGVTGGAPNLLGSFTASARPLPENVEWQRGGTDHTPENCGFPWVWQGCPRDDEDPEKPLNEGADDVTFRPFLVEYNAQSCVGIPGDWNQLEARARRGLAVRLSNGIALALSSSAPDGTPNQNPNLPDSAIDVTPLAGPSDLVHTLAGLLQDAFACGLTGEVFIHAPAWTLPWFFNNTQITQVGSVFKLGPHTVVFDQGYTNEGPTGLGSDPDVPASPAAGPGQAYIYVTGPFEYATTAIQVLDDTTRGVSPRLNRANVIAAQLAIYRFDPCCVFAALAEAC